MKDDASLDAVQFGSNHAADYRIALPIERLGPGEYLLAIDATQGRVRDRAQPPLYRPIAVIVPPLTIDSRL